MTRVIVTASSNLPGVSLNPGAISVHQPGTQDDTEDANAPDHYNQSGCNEIREDAGLVTCFRRKITGEYRNECGGERSLAKQITGEIRKREADAKGIEDRSGAEHRREHDFAHQPGDAANSHCDGDDPRRTHYAVGLAFVLRETASAKESLSIILTV